MFYFRTIFFFPFKPPEGLEKTTESLSWKEQRIESKLICECPVAVLQRTIVGGEGLQRTPEAFLLIHSLCASCRKRRD